MNLEDIKKVSTFGYSPLIKNAVLAAMEENGIVIEGLSDKEAGALISKEAPATLRYFVLDNPDAIGTTQTFTLLANGRVDGYFKDRVTMESAALDKNTSPEQLMLADAFLEAGAARNILSQVGR